MNSRSTKFFAFLIYFLAGILLPAQNKEWITEFTEDGNTKVVYAIYDSLYANGEEELFIEYYAETKSSASIYKCAEIFNNPEAHKIFYEYTEESNKLKQISDAEWIIYYFYNPPWPIANSDCVSRITMKYDSLNSKITFTSFSESNLMEMKDVSRSELNDITFTFTKVNEEETLISISAILIPITFAPSWMISAWFPEGPGGTLRRFKELAESNKGLK